VARRDEGPNGEESETVVSLEDARPQMPRQLELPWGSRGEAPSAPRSEEASTAANGTERSGTSDLMERVVSRPNLQAALKRVRKNKGSPGIDGMTVDELPDFLRANWSRLREQMLAGSYQPQAVQRRLIPKGGGGMRELGIPTVLDRFIRQALLQVLQPRFDPTFSEHSHGFRPGRRAHDAVREAQRHVQEGRWWVVDVDLEKFFDRVHHDVLMGKLAKRIEDKRVLGLVRRYLDAGIMVNGVVTERHEGTPQGGPLSPLLANVLLDEVDKELEKRGHAFVRYADDCNVYVRSRRAGERVIGLLRRLYAGLRLRINESKSAVAPASKRQFLGFAFWYGPGSVVRRRLAPKALGRMKDRVRLITRRTRGRSLRQVCEDLKGYLSGWKQYFQLVETPRILARLDEWIRHRLRALQLKQWKRGRTIFRELRRRGLSRDVAAKVAAYGHCWWKNSAMAIHIALPNSLFDELGLPRLAA
jgi:group II intron reverse transcriptase/maturase